MTHRAGSKTHISITTTTYKQTNSRMLRRSQLLSSSRSIKSSRFFSFDAHVPVLLRCGSNSTFFLIDRGTTLLRCGLLETPFPKTVSGRLSFISPGPPPFFFEVLPQPSGDTAPMNLLDQGFEADIHISRMVPGLVQQGNRQVICSETRVQALHRLQSLGRRTPGCVRLFILQTKLQFQSISLPRC